MWPTFFTFGVTFILLFWVANHIVLNNLQVNWIKKLNIFLFFLFYFFFVEQGAPSPPPTKQDFGSRWKKSPIASRTTDNHDLFSARMMFIPGLRREMRVVALLLIVYFMSLTWTGKAQYILYVFPLQCEPVLASVPFGVASISVFKTGRFTELCDI